jgi:hypothetical protein
MSSLRSLDPARQARTAVFTAWADELGGSFERGPGGGRGEPRLGDSPAAFEQRDGKGRWLPGTTPRGARPWRKGQAPNPTGKGGDYHEALKLARKTSMRSITRLIELRESEDEQIATVASKALWEISWGKPQVFDPKAEALEEHKNRGSFNPRAYSPEDLAIIEAALLLMRQGGSAPTEPEVIPPGDR